MHNNATINKSIGASRARINLLHIVPLCATIISLLN